MQDFEGRFQPQSVFSAPTIRVSKSGTIFLKPLFCRSGLVPHLLCTTQLSLHNDHSVGRSLRTFCQVLSNTSPMTSGSYIKAWEHQNSRQSRYSSSVAICLSHGSLRARVPIHEVTRACSHSSQPNESAREMNKRQEGGGKLVVAGGDSSEVLEACEETFDQVAIPVDMPIERARIDAIRARRNHCLSALRGNHLDKGVGVVPFVGNDESSLLILDERCGLFDVGDLSSRKNHAQRIAQGIHGNVQFGGQAAPRAADFLAPDFFWAPAECWCARTMVESMNRCSMSASPCMARATHSQIPFSRQREKRTKVRCQWPSSAGRSRHGLPVRMTQRTASTKRRLSWAVRPGSLALPGSSCSIRSHWSSRNIFRSILTPPKSQDMTIFD